MTVDPTTALPATKENGTPFDKWCDLLDAHHEQQRQAGKFEGYGPGPLVAVTGKECWLEFYDNGACPEDALEEDRECW